MAVSPSLTISINRSGMAGAPAPLVFSGLLDSNQLGITEYEEPAMLPIVSYATPHDGRHGDPDPLSWRYAQTFLAWKFVTDLATTEQASRNLIADVRAAIAQALEFSVTVTVSGATAEVWTCNPGSLTPAGARARIDMTDPRPEWAVSLPAYPVRS